MILNEMSPFLGPVRNFGRVTYRIYEAFYFWDRMLIIKD
jgi:hypothetical protein